MSGKNILLLLVKHSDYPPLPPKLYRTSHDPVKNEINRLTKLHPIRKIYDNCVANLKQLFDIYDKYRK
jgi:hypothetical protein